MYINYSMKSWKVGKAFIIFLLIGIQAFAGTLFASTTDSLKTIEPPGVVVDHIAKSTGCYVGSPSICIMPNGDYVASHDEFGPNSGEHNSAKTLIFESKDKGKSWRKICQIDGQFWSNLFQIKGDLYIMGMSKNHGNVIIRKSADEGMTWTIPINRKSGLILEGEYHTAPTPMAVYKGRIWRAVEDATSETKKWPERYSAMMLSAPVNSDLLDGDNWIHTERQPSDKSYLNGACVGWLEGNAVVTKKGIVDVLRVHSPSIKDKEYLALLDVNSVSPIPKFYEFPGGSKKFTIRYDKKTRLYWTIVNNIPASYQGKAQTDQLRNFCSVATSKNLKTWIIRKLIFSHDDFLKHAFQYVDWLFEGKDIILVSRTAFDDKEGGADNYHNANYLTFYRISNYKSILK